jgi:uncharacterized protein (TIGR02284 family)
LRSGIAVHVAQTFSERRHKAAPGHQHDALPAIFNGFDQPDHRVIWLFPGRCIVSHPKRETLLSDTAVKYVIEILIDSQDGLATVGERLRSPALPRYFFAESLMRAQFIDQLSSVLRQRGVRTFREKGSAAAILHRTWARVKSRFIGGDHTLLVTAEQGEHAVNEVYKQALETYLPTSIREILTVQKAHVELVHAFVKTERDRLAAANKTARSTMPASGQASP